MSKNVRPKRRREPKLEMDTQGWKSLGIALLKIAIVCALAIGIPYGAYALYCSYAESGAFVPKNITVQGNLRQSDDAILDALGFALDDANLAEMDVRAVESAIETLPWVQKANVKVKLPDTVRIQITEYEPLGIVNDGSLSLIDTNGEFIKYWRDDDELTAPIVTLDNPLAERTHEAIRAFEIAALAHKLGYDKKIHEIQYDKGVGYTLYTETTEIRLGYDRFKERLSRLLQVESVLESRHVVAQYILLDADDDLDRIVVKPASATVDSTKPAPRTDDNPPAPNPDTAQAKTDAAQAKTDTAQAKTDTAQAKTEPKAPDSNSAIDKGSLAAPPRERIIHDDEDLALPPLILEDD
ncbi:MAG: FtsQ-type POTRA domain-containing protein [Bradymonadales bacterium]|nr:FtsQ-type POTRA domain-containing protein [Bradymonadales bacterium]